MYKSQYVETIHSVQLKVTNRECVEVIKSYPL